MIGGMNQDHPAPMTVSDTPPSAATNRNALKVAVIAAGGDSVPRARRLLDRLATELKPGFELQHSVWKFELLTSTTLRELATSEAVQADLVIVAPEAPGDLPPEVKMVFERWVREGRKGLVILSERAGWEGHDGDVAGGPAPVVNYFRQLSAAWDFDFFQDAEGSPRARVAAPAVASLPAGELDPASLLRRLGRTPPGLVHSLRPAR